MKMQHKTHVKEKRQKHTVAKVKIGGTSYSVTMPSFVSFVQTSIIKTIDNFAVLERANIKYGHKCQLYVLV